MQDNKGRALMALMAICCAFCFLLVAGAGVSLAGRWKDNSERFEAECRAWCTDHPDVCYDCSTLRGCGQGLENLRSWTGYGKNWHACKKRPSRHELTLGYFEECRRWCDANKPPCDKCLRTTGCGAGYKVLKTFKGRGHNVHACERRSNTEARQTECEEWCTNNKPRCAKCSKKSGCGAGYKTIKKFKGKGKNYYACEDRGHSVQNERNCNVWCEQNREYCNKCQKSSVCPVGLTAIKAWKGKGKNWYACGDIRYLDQKNRRDCERWCGDGNDCVQCMRIAGCGAGYKAIKTFGGKGHNWYACKDRGGSEENYRRCRAFCFDGSANQCRKCSRSPGCGEGYEQLQAFRGKGKNWYACKVKVHGRGAGAPLSLPDE